MRIKRFLIRVGNKALFEPNTYFNNETIAKYIRFVLVAFLFICSFQLLGLQTRMAQQFIFVVGGLVLFGFLLKNIWIAGFLWYSVFLWVFYKFAFGHLYLIHIFFGCLLYLLTKLAFKKEHIKFFVIGVLWLIVANILYSIVQVNGYDWMYVLEVGGGKIVPNLTHPSGFMSNDSIYSMLMALGVPLLAVINLWLAPILFIPICIAKGSVNFAAAGAAYLFILFFKINRKIWVILVLVVALMGTGYYFFIDKPDWNRLSQWKLALQDTVVHPVTGWGLDSYRSDNLPHKKHVYAITTQDAIIDGKREVDMAIWDNPHNLLISLMFEWGLIGLFIFFGYLRFLGLRFKHAIKDPTTLGLAGFIVVLLIVSLAHFPLFLARMCVIIIPMVALFEKSTE